MSKIIYLLLFTFSVFIVSSCQKKKPRKGKYTGVFTYSNPSNYGAQSFRYEITESNKSYLIMSYLDEDGEVNVANLDTLFKQNDKTVKGRIHHKTPFFAYAYVVEGEWDNAGLFKGQKIEGTFTQILYSQGGGEYEASGTFILTK